MDCKDCTTERLCDQHVQAKALKYQQDMFDILFKEMELNLKTKIKRENEL